jgi:alcohol dehydrogenase
MAKEEKMVRLAEAMGEPVQGLAPREAARKALEAIRHLLKSVDLPTSLGDLNIKDKSKIGYWAVEAHKEQRLLSRSPRILSVKDIEKIYERAF